MTGGIAALPMYDWPEARGAVDRLWAAIRDRLRAAGHAAPDALTRGMGLMQGWMHPRLVLGQACGLPLVRELDGRVAVIGAADHAIPGCPPGWYRSVVVVGSDDRRHALAEFRGARLAVNGVDSQSGWAALLHHAAPLAPDGRFFGAAAPTGGHARSAERVAAGAADLAAIDAVTWGCWLRHRPVARRLRVLMLTDPTPGLPYIAAPGVDVPATRAALAGAIDGLGHADRAALGLAGFAPLGRDDYALVAARFAAASAMARNTAATASAPASGAPVRSVPPR